MTTLRPTSNSVRSSVRFLSRVAGALVIALGTLSAAPAFAAVGEWSTPVNLSESGQSAGDPRIAVDGSGNAVAVWLRFDADSNNIAQSSWSDDGGASWSVPVNLSQPGEWASNVSVVLDGSGIAHAIWSRYDGNNARVQYAQSVDAGASWSTPINLSTAGADASRPQIAADGSGSLVAVWRGSDGSNDIIQSSRSTNSGASWSTQVDLSVSGENADSPRVAFSGAGIAVAVWLRSDGSNQITQASRSTNGGASWSTPADLSVSGVDSTLAKIAFDGSGNALAVWLLDPFGESTVQSSRLLSGGVSWSTPVTLSTSGNSAATPQVAVGESGNAVAIWRYYADGGTIIQSSYSADGGASWSTPVQLSASGLASDDPQVAVDGTGNVFAIWRQSNGSDRIIRSSKSTDGGASWAGVTDLSEDGQSANHEIIAVDGSGNAVALWSRSNGENNIIQSSYYRALSGGGGGGEELANTGPSESVNTAVLVASAGLLALGVVTRVLVRRRMVGSLE